jgi:histidinol phosphatase-like PHP family hydrolase
VKEGVVCSLAHSFINYGKLSRAQTEARISAMLDAEHINALEINASAPPESVELCIGIAKRLGAILTFGSDCHFTPIGDGNYTDM